EEAFLQDGIARVPQREREAELLVRIADAGKSVLAPAIRAAAGVVVRKIFPRGAARAVILTHGPPLTFGEVRSPALPLLHAGGILGEPAAFGRLIGKRLRFHGGGVIVPKGKERVERKSRGRAA